MRKIIINLYPNNFNGRIHKIQAQYIELFRRYEGKDVTLMRTDIAWPIDKLMKFSNPIECNGIENYTGCLKQTFSRYAKPKYWIRNLWELDTANPDNNGLQNEDLIVWMRTAAFPTFRKPYRKIKHADPGNIATSEQFKTGIPKGRYNIMIKYNFEVNSFSGSKKVILSTVGMFGGKNTFLGIAYTVVGLSCIVLGVFLLVNHKLYGKRLKIGNNITSSNETVPDDAPLDNVTKIFLHVPQNNYIHS